MDALCFYNLMQTLKRIWENTKVLMYILYILFCLFCKHARFSNSHLVKVRTLMAFRMIKCTITKYTIYTSYTRLVNVLTVSKASTT